MKNYFIYQYEDIVSSNQKLIVTSIFIHQTKIKQQNSLSQEINIFFQEHSITDLLVVILPEYIDKDSFELFTIYREKTFERIPGKSKEYFDKNLIIYQFNVNGDLIKIYGKISFNEIKFTDCLFRSGSTIIFKQNGGLVESTPDHHFVFPSKKHCSKFLRTGNVLINHPEIFFLSIQILKYINGINSIYCDTSSINVLPYTVFELLRRFNIEFDCPTVNSFQSYELFESHNEKFPHDSLILISSSTSGNIIDRILKQRLAEKSQMKVIYFLGPKENYNNHQENIICNLTKDEIEFPMGEEIFDSNENSDIKCILCENNSRPIQIRSDVFLTIQPRVENVLLNIKPECTPSNISTFIKRFGNNKSVSQFIKTYYKDNDGNANYDIYFDFCNLIKQVNEGGISSFKDSLDRYINKNIPANTKYLLYLPDSGSLALADYIKTKIPSSINPNIIKLESNFEDKISNENCTVVIVASCITTGKKLLQISRLMRENSKISLIYFVGIFRPLNEKFSKQLINDLAKGKDKSDERPFVAVEKIYCTIEQKNTYWADEKYFFEQLIGDINEEEYKILSEYVNCRIDILRNNKVSKGLFDNVFLRTHTNKELILRKNFAFWDFEYSENTTSQSEVYFQISSIITNLENKEINSNITLKQSNYVRNILSPRNFHRFNDGIIQAALLRSCKSEYLSYDLDDDSNLKMKEFLFSIIDKYDTSDGEAIMEFLLSIGLKRLKMKNSDMKEIVNKGKQCQNQLISEFSTYIYTQL